MIGHVLMNGADQCGPASGRLKLKCPLASALVRAASSIPCREFDQDNFVPGSRLPGGSIPQRAGKSFRRAKVLAMSSQKKRQEN